MADSMNGDTVMDLNLNQEPSVESPPPPSLSVEPFLNGSIEDHIREVEAIATRIRQRQRWRQARNNPESSYMAVFEPGIGAINENQSGNGVENEIRVNEGSVNPGGGERRRKRKRKISRLTKALDMDLDSKKTNEGGGFFDCSICLDMAKDPILTCCGHLFCWSCFYQVSYVDINAKECPVCKGEATDSSITPIYGNGEKQPILKLEGGLKIPPRPRAHRVERSQREILLRLIEVLTKIREEIHAQNNKEGFFSTIWGWIRKKH